jgi:hypothetical protein
MVEQLHKNSRLLRSSITCLRRLRLKKSPVLTCLGHRVSCSFASDGFTSYITYCTKLYCVGQLRRLHGEGIGPWNPVLILHCLSRVDCCHGKLPVGFLESPFEGQTSA